MKRLAILLLTASSALSSLAQARLTGCIKDYQGGNVIVAQTTDDDSRYDTLTVAADGRFDATISVLKPANAYFVSEEPKASAIIFLEDGMKADLQISFKTKAEEGETITVMDVDYSGDNRDCFDFNRQHEASDNFEAWPWERLSATPFSEYRNAVEEDIERSLVALYQVKSEHYRRAMTEQIRYEEFSYLCRWAWAKHDKTDDDFDRWICSFDHNDTANIDKAFNYWRWYSDRHMPRGEARTPQSFYQVLRKAFNNQDIINMYADNHIQAILKDAPDNMDEELAAYKAVSTNPEGQAEAQRLYDHYAKLKKGAPAADFEMYDRDGKRYTLQDLRGKAVYIDCWATWCGPCVAETPHMAKLYEHYKGDSRIELIAISLDQNRRAWEKKLTAEKPQWRQFICPDHFNSALCKNYDIDGIPRFLMFDAQGRIVSLDAPRPSSEKIVEWIEKNLQ